MWAVYLLLIIVGIYLLIKGANIFIGASTSIARVFKLSEIFIGMTLVCVGTGLPEFVLAILASIRGDSSIVIGNIIGTNMFNMCAIFGIICIIKPIKLLKGTVRKDINMSLITALAFFFVIFDTPFTILKENIISRTDGLILLLFYLIYVYYTIYEFGGLSNLLRIRINNKGNIVKEKTIINKDQKKKIFRLFVICVIGSILIYLGSQSVLIGTTKLAEIIGISEIFISIMIIAIGTSLPEISTSIVAVKKGSVNIALGNLVGSNMMNALFSIGISAIINPIKVVTNSLWVDASIFIVICTIIAINARLHFIKKGEYEISRTEGITLITIYVIYVAYVVFRG